MNISTNQEKKHFDYAKQLRKTIFKNSIKSSHDEVTNKFIKLYYKSLLKATVHVLKKTTILKLYKDGF